MQEELTRDAAEMILCAGCTDAVDAGECCPTCGALDPRQKGSDAPSVRDERLLDRVGLAVVAQGKLARHAATRGREHAARPDQDAVALASRLRQQSSLLQARIAERKQLLPALEAMLDRAQAALDQADRHRSSGHHWAITVRLPRDPSCAKVARRLLAEYVRDAFDEVQRADAMLIASELAANAYCHGKGAILLKVNCAVDRLRIDVIDEGRPERIGVVPERERDGGGRGLWIVERLTSAWGAVPGTGHVWAELHLGEH